MSVLLISFSPITYMYKVASSLKWPGQQLKKLSRVQFQRMKNHKSEFQKIIKQIWGLWEHLFSAPHFSLCWWASCNGAGLWLNKIYFSAGSPDIRGARVLPWISQELPRTLQTQWTIWTYDTWSTVGKVPELVMGRMAQRVWAWVLWLVMKINLIMHCVFH